MKKISFVSFSMVAACAVLPVSAKSAIGVFGDTPNAKHAWSVHDRNRPNPVKISAEAGAVPSDAIVLFDGTKESFEKNWCDKNGNPTKWKLGNEGDFYCTNDRKNGGNIYSRQSFGDCQLHVEFRHPKEDGIVSDSKGPQMHGNSGVFLMSKYEVQVLESYGTNPADMKNPNYADGQAGAIYAQNPPMVNPARRPGEWQTYDIIFHQPIWDGIKLIHPASITVLFNGVVVQDHWEMDRFTSWKLRTSVVPHETKLPISFQDHGCQVHYRNIWIREIPSRYANRTHGGPGVDENAVMALRRETAAKLYAQIAKPIKPTIESLEALGEVISYVKEGEYESTWQKVANEFHDVLDKMSDAEWNANKKELLHLRDSLDTLIRNGIVTQKCGTRKRISAAALRLGWEK
jgi:hypothetical protein